MTVRRATDLLSGSLEEVASVVGRSYRTVVAYRLGERRVPDDVKEKLAAYMRDRGGKLAEAAEELEGEG